MSLEPEHERNSGTRFAGWVVVGVGVLWMTLSGACAVTMLTQSDTDPNAQAMYTMFAIVGGVSALIGLGIFMLGRWLAR